MTPTFQECSKSLKQRFHALDTLRGFAALAVVVYHLMPSFRGYLAVDFFLVLSGFVLSHVYLYGEKKVTFSTFLGKRFFRMYPLHLVTLMGVGVLFFIAPELKGHADYGVMTFWQNVGLVQCVGLPPHVLSWNVPSWSISAEFWINVLFIVFISRRTPTWLLLSVSTLIIAIINWQSSHLNVHTQNYWHAVNAGLLRCAASFLLGIVAYRGHMCRPAAAWLGRWTSWGQGVLLLLAAAAIAVPENRLFFMDYAAPFVFAALVYVMAHASGPAACLGKLRYVGLISYSIYLNQILVDKVLCLRFDDLRENQPWIYLGIFIPILLVVSAGTYHLIEVPCNRGLRRVLTKKPA